MQRLQIAGLMLVLAVFGAMTVASAMAQSRGETSRKPITPSPKVSVGSKALQGPVKLGPAFSKELAGLVLPPDWEAEEKLHKQLRSRYTNWKYNYEKYTARVDACLSKDHTVSDQQAAGCLPSDPLALCMDKLYNQCLLHPPQSPSRAMVEAGIPGLVDAAKALSTAASNLSKRIPNALPKLRNYTSGNNR